MITYVPQGGGTGSLRSPVQVAFYGAPLWVDSLTARNKALLWRSQRVTAVRAIRGCRMVTWTAATLLASDSPWLTQVLTGNGCFGKYLHRIARREMAPSCGGAPSDTARHTLIEIAAWGPQRHSLAVIVGGELSLPSVINAMIDNESCWKEMVLFCENVMTQKEAAERDCENSAADPLR
ncbi:uncharacterized protein LOC125077341 [Vanessa atalanta]|uniref:uncharacterized protein LOC125077341 n=1 Tax=Vanessa atalanta TaxID=42275 RepID=UPI001FCCEF67|nr:uncharacterized protein LOC125077341 [Vanessa atalanta]